jgi:pimeloyl-ACP methyl ester carboxylesterase
MPTVYFARGKESGPWGAKIVALADVARARGYHVESPDYSDIQDADKRVERLLKHCGEKGADALVGSSMGGYVSTVASAVMLNVYPASGAAAFALLVPLICSSHRNIGAIIWPFAQDVVGQVGEASSRVFPHTRED